MYCCLKQRKSQFKMRKKDCWMGDLEGNYYGLSTAGGILYPVLGTML